MSESVSLLRQTDCRQSITRNPFAAANVALALVFAAAAVVVTFRVWTDIFVQARDDSESGQVFLTPVAFLWIIWARRGLPWRVVPLGSLIGPFIVAAGGTAWWTGFYRGPDVLCQCGAVVMVVGAALTFLGASTLVKFWPAFLALAFAIPITGPARDYVSAPLQLITARITQSVCEVIGMNVERLGNVLTINGRAVAIAEACNGLRMIWPLFIITYLFAFVTPVRPWLRVVVLLASPLVAVAANVTRLVPTVWVYGHCSASAASVFHELAGWVMLLAAFLALVGIARLIPSAVSPAKAISPGKPVVPTGRAFSPDRERQQNAGRLIAASLTALLLAWAGWAAWKMPVEADSFSYHLAVRDAGAAVPMEIGHWVGRDVPPIEGTESLLSPNLIISRQYTDRITRRQARVLLVQVRNPRVLLYHTAMICYPSQGWEPVWHAPHEWTIDGVKLTGMEYEFWRSPFQQSAGLIVADMMLLPDGRIVPDVETVRKRSRSAGQRFFGAAHLQIACDASIPTRDRETIVREVLAGFVPLIRTIGSGMAPQ